MGAGETFQPSPQAGTHGEEAADGGKCDAARRAALGQAFVSESGFFAEHSHRET
jgi:hypothetical protein